MNIPSTSTSTSTSTTSLDASQTSSSFLATVRNRLGGSSFALPSLLNDQDGSQQDSETRQDGQENEDDEEEDEDLEGMMWDAQKALISHNTPLAISLYSKALLLPPSSNPSPAAALALGNLLSRGPDDRHLQVGGGGAGATKSKMKKRREWETMNRAAGVYLVGLAGELERAGVVVVVVGKERERESRGGSSTTNGILVQKGGEVGSGKISNPAIALENAHELASHLLSLYRRGLVHPSDPPVPLPISPPHHPLLSPEQGDSKKNTNIWQLAQYLAGEALAADWNLKEQTMPLESPGRGEHSGSSARSEALKRSLKMHLHYLLALTSHATSPHESLDNFRTLLSLGPSNLKEATELLTSAQERVVSLEKRIASLELPPSQPPSPSVATLSPYSSTASTFGPSTATNGKGNGNGNGNGPLSRTTRTPATPFTLSPQTTPSHQHALPSFPFPRQPPLPLPSTAATTPTLATTQTSLAFPSSSSNNLPSSSSSSSNLRTYSRSPSLMSLQPQVTDQPFPFRLTRRTSTFSTKSGVSLSPSMLSMRLSGSRSGVVEGTIDESVIAEGAVSKVLPSSRTGGGGAGSWVGSWFGGGKKAGAEGSLRRLAVSSSRTMRAAGMAEDVERGERIGSGYANGGKGKGRERPRIQSMFESQPSSSSREEDSFEEERQQPESSTSTSSTRPSTSSSTTRPFTPKASSPLPPALSPSHFLPPPATTSSTTTPNSTLSLLSPSTHLKPTTNTSQSQPSSPRTKLAAAFSHLRSAPSNPHLSRFGDQALDPQLRQLEMDSIITKGVSCGVCEREGVNLPACPRCGVRFCSRECRVGELGAGDGKKHVCGLLEKRKVSSSSSVAVPLTKVVAGNHTPRRKESKDTTTVTTVQKAIVV